MYNLKGKTVFITGSSSGIGEACAISFASAGANLVLSARRYKKLEEIKEKILKDFPVKIHIGTLDVTRNDKVIEFVNNLPDEFKVIDILINNAGLALGLEKLYLDDVQNWEGMIDTNIKGLLYVTRAIVPQMVERKSGHVINLGSVAGRDAYAKGSVYCATKHAELAITRSLRADVLEAGIRVSTIDPGMVETNFSNIRFHGDEEKAKAVYKGIKPLVAEDIADLALFIATRPAHVNINELVVCPTAQAGPFYIHKEL